ncbi:MAG: helix-turn-helix transcriptional regulator [Eubacterium sp.]|nr:helix-turn-helix transcriptional regulator [Eubacterium sp.]
MDAETANHLIGNKIKELRKQNELTQQELADRTELTKGFISQLENGQVSPSVVTLFDLIECLGTTPSEFFLDSGSEEIVSHTEDYFEKTDEEGNRIQWIIPSAQGRKMEPVLVTLAPHGKLESDAPHEGEEFGYVLSGTVQIDYGERVFKAKAGESFYYEARKNHRIENPTGRKAEFIWISTPPSF